MSIRVTRFKRLLASILLLWFLAPTDVQASDDEQLSVAAKKLRESVVLIGLTKGGHGTGWVLSREHRLIATNAHVADICFNNLHDTFVTPNLTNHRYSVTKVWYHPGLLRQGRGILTRSQTPTSKHVNQELKVFSMSADVAVLELAKDSDLPPEIPMASPAEISDLFATPVSMIGFPGHDTYNPKKDDLLQATPRTGTISRMTDYTMSSNGPDGFKQFVQHSLANFGGFSGSPIFTKSGHVVVINNSGRVEEDRGMRQNLSFGIRIDALWELIAYHKLDDKVSLPVTKASLQLERFEMPSELTEKFEKAILLVDDCDEHDWSTAAGIEKAIHDLDRAIELAPGYPAAYERRAVAKRKLARFNKAEELTLLQSGLADAKKRFNLEPDNLDAANQALWHYYVVSAKDNNRYHGQIALMTTRVLEGELFRNSLYAKTHYPTSLYYLRSLTRDKSQSKMRLEDVSEAIKAYQPRKAYVRIVDLGWNKGRFDYRVGEVVDEFSFDLWAIAGRFKNGVAQRHPPEGKNIDQNSPYPTLEKLKQYRQSISQ